MRSPEERLQKLEKTMRLMAMLCAASLCAATALFLMLLRTNHPKALNVHRLAITDAMGRARYEVGFDSKNCLVQQFLDQNEAVRLITSINAKGEPSELFLDEHKNIRISASLNGNDTSLCLSDAQNVVRALLSSQSDGKAELMIADGSGQPRHAIIAEAKGSASQFMFDAGGVIRISSSVMANNRTIFQLLDEHRKDRLNLVVLSNAVLEAMFDATGALRNLSGVDAEGRLITTNAIHRFQKARQEAETP